MQNTIRSSRPQRRVSPLKYLLSQLTPWNGTLHEFHATSGHFISRTFNFIAFNNMAVVMASRQKRHYQETKAKSWNRNSIMRYDISIVINYIPTISLENAVFWIVTPSGSWKNVFPCVRRFLVTVNVPSSPILVTLMTEAIRSSETSVIIRTTRFNILEDGFLHSHYRENLKSYKINFLSLLLFLEDLYCIKCHFVEFFLSTSLSPILLSY
jgi:hypothetical protein